MAGQRDQWIVATKFGHHFTKPFDRDLRFGPEQVQSQLESSLRALRTDTIDLYQFHSGDDETLQTSGLWEMLQRQKEAGKIRHLGISISSKLKDTFQVDQSTTLGVSAIQAVHEQCPTWTKLLSAERKKLQHLLLGKVIEFLLAKDNVVRFLSLL